MDSIWNSDLKQVQDILNQNNVDCEYEGVRPLQQACLRAWPDIDVVKFLLIDLKASYDFEVRPGVSFFDELRAMAEKSDAHREVFACVEKVELNGHLNATLPSQPHVNRMKL